MIGRKNGGEPPDRAQKADAQATKFRTLLRAVSLQRVKARLTDPYRPELHYMRGPGPKCAERARLQRRAAKTDGRE